MNRTWWVPCTCIILSSRRRPMDITAVYPCARLIKYGIRLCRRRSKSLIYKLKARWLQLRFTAPSAGPPSIQLRTQTYSCTQVSTHAHTHRHTHTRTIKKTETIICTSCCCYSHCHSVHNYVQWSTECLPIIFKAHAWTPTWNCLSTSNCLRI